MVQLSIDWASYFNFAGLGENIKEHAIFLAEFAGIVAGIILLAYLAELLIRRKTKPTEKILSTRKVAGTGILAAMAGILMTFEFPLLFAPSFYKLDFSELPVLICGFAYGPVAGVLCEAVKILVKLVIKGTGTAFVGELANFVVGCFLVLPATIIYHTHRTKKRALIGCIVGTVCITVAGPVFNAVYLLPTFATMWGCDLSYFIAEGTKKVSAVNNLTTFVILCVAPLNLIKGVAVSAVTMLIYQPLRPLLKKNM